MIQKEQTTEYLMACFKQSSDEKIFEKIVIKLTPSALSVARSILNKRSLAEDAVQETFMKVIRNKDRYDSELPFAKWFFAILRNTCTDILRKDIKNKQFLSDTIVVRQTLYFDNSNYDELDMLSILDEKHRSVLILRVVHSLKFYEIAETLNISEEVAKKRAQRGLAKLRQHLVEKKDLPRLAV